MLKTVYLPDLKEEHTFIMYAPRLSDFHVFLLSLLLSRLEIVLTTINLKTAIFVFISFMVISKLFNKWLKQSAKMTVHISQDGIIVTSKYANFDFSTVKNIVIGQEKAIGRLFETVPDNLVSITMIGVSSNQTIFVYNNGDSLINNEIPLIESKNIEE